MESVAIYLLKSVIWLTGFALVFILFLRNERFFVLNRVYLVAGILTSFFFPLVSVHYTVTIPVLEKITAEESIFNGIKNSGFSNTPDFGLMLMVLYLTGVFIVFVMIIKQSRSVLRVINRAEIIPEHPVRLIRTGEYSYSFSFFSYVFVNPSVTDVETKEIVNHEQVHIRQWHWIDLVLAELLCMLQWFNPLVWIYVRFIRQNHEYLADEVALQRTSDPAVYRAALLNQIVGSPVVSLANSFNYSLNKKRFNMMKNIISSPYRKIKILLILPVFAIMLYAFAKPDYKYTYGDSQSGIDTVSTALTKAVKGSVVQQDGKPLQGATIIVSGTTLGASTDAKGFFSLDNVPDDGSLVVSYVGFKSLVVKPVFTTEMTIRMMRDTVKFSNLTTAPPPPPPAPEIGVVIRNSENPQATPPLIVIDGVISAYDISILDPNAIQSMNVLKNEFAEKKYGEKGKNGVIEITTKKVYSTSTGEKIQDVKVTGYTGDQKVSKSTGVFTVTEEMPEFPGGGREGMTAWIYSNIKYPGEAVKKKITGKVYVDFMVSSTGKVKDVVVSKPVHPLLDAEAKRVISNMPDWKPGSQAGKPVDVQMQVPVEFKLK
jgi:TonB family protein